MSLDNIFQSLQTLPLPAQLVAVFVFSLLVGSFLNVVIYRLPLMLESDWRVQAREILELEPVEETQITLTKPRSRCRDCGRMVKATENIPVLSYLLMKGKCRGCQATISVFYPIVELFTAALATFVFWHFGANLQGVCAVFFVYALIALTGIDAKHQYLPDIITLPLMWVGIIISFWVVYIPLETAVIGVVVSYLSLWFIALLGKVLFKKEAMGMGDAKLLAAIFAWTNIQYLPLVLIIACVVGIIVAIVRWVFGGGKLLGNPLPFGPYLALAGLIALLYGEQLFNSYTRFLMGY